MNRPDTYESEFVEIDSLKPWPRNYKTHGDDQVAVLGNSLRTFGQFKNVVVWGDFIIAGHGLIDAARSNGYDEVEVKRLPQDFTEEMVEAVLVADNESSRLAKDDTEQLAELLLSVRQADADLLLSTGWDSDELDELLRGMGGDLGMEGADTEPELDRAEELRAEWGVELDQCWQLGPHKIICGDCTDPAVVERLMGGEKADCVVTDPPYGMNLDTSYANSIDNPEKGVKSSRGYAPVAGDDKPYDPTHLFESFEADEFFLWGADYYMQHLPDGGSWIVWDKRSSVEDVDYSSSEFELCWSMIPHHRKILRVPWFGIIGMEKQDTKIRVHPTQKPIGVIEPIISEHCGSIIVDPFCGSGTTIIASHNLNRICRAAEISPAYVAVILQRYLDHTGIQPELIG